MLLGGGGNPSAWYAIRVDRQAHDGRGSAVGVAQFVQGNDWLGISLTTLPTPPADLWWAPIETVSNSEGGFERVYQGSAVLLSWPLDLAPGGEIVVAVEQRVVVTGDPVVR